MRTWFVGGYENRSEAISHRYLDDRNHRLVGLASEMLKGLK